MHQHFNECASSVRIGTGPQLSRVSSVGNTAQWGTPLRRLTRSACSVHSVRSRPPANGYHNYFHLIEQRSVRVERFFFLYFLLFFPWTHCWGAPTRLERERERDGELERALCGHHSRLGCVYCAICLSAFAFMDNDDYYAMSMSMTMTMRILMPMMMLLLAGKTWGRWARVCVWCGALRT